MKIYNQQPQLLVRIEISQQGKTTEYLTLCETNKEEVRTWFENLIRNSTKYDPFANGRITKVYIRDAVGAKNGKSVSASFRGLDPQQTIEIIKNELTK